MGRQKKITRETIQQKAINELRELDINIDDRTSLVNLIIELNSKAYIEGIDKGVDIAKGVYSPKEKTAPQKPE